MKTFEPNKNAKELNIDLTRKFIVVEKSIHSPHIGDILEIKEDDDTTNPLFWNLTRDSNGYGSKHETEDKWWCVALWSQLAYYEKPKTATEIMIEMQNKIATEARIEQYKRDGTFFHPWGKVMPDGKVYWGKSVADILENYKYNTPTDTPKPIVKGNKIMSIITNAFKSKEDKALEYFNLGDSKQLNEEGRKEFVNYIFETGDTTKKGFLAKMVEAYKEEKK